MTSTVNTPPVFWRACVLHFLDDPDKGAQSWEYFDDGGLLVESGCIKACGPAETLLKQLPEGCEIRDLSGKLIVPGFIDTHVHYPQLEVMAGCGVQLLDWLEQYTFPAEARFSDPEYARDIAELFLDQCLNNGTTTALVFGTVAPQSVDAFFEAAQKRNMRVVNVNGHLTFGIGLNPGEVVELTTAALIDDHGVTTGFDHIAERLESFSRQGLYRESPGG